MLKLMVKKILTNLRSKVLLILIYASGVILVIGAAEAYCGSLVTGYNIILHVFINNISLI